MSSWSRRRRSIYTIVTIILLIVVIVIPGFYFFYKAPTCSDGVMNGSEQGVDCGGKCARLCPSAFLTPQIAWTRFEQIAPNIYNIAAYVVNPNTDGGAKNAPYHIVLYDNRGEIISEKEGTMTLPPHRNTLAFIGAYSTGARVPSKALFEFTAIPNWIKQSDPLGHLVVLNKEYTEDDRSGSLTVTIKNNDVHPVGRTTVYVVLYDASGNSIGFSKTILDSISAGGTAVAPFTWPISRNGTVISIEVLPVSE